MTTQQLLDDEERCSQLGRTYDCPLPLSAIPNMMGISLCSVEGVTWTRQDDGQLVSVQIHFLPDRDDAAPIKAQMTDKCNRVQLRTDVKVMDQAGRDIVDECEKLADMLLRKNAAYGNSALDPLRVFSQASTVEQILVRLDDKLSRLKRGSAAGEDVISDLLGYLILLRIAQGRPSNNM